MSKTNLQKKTTDRMLDGVEGTIEANEDGTLIHITIKSPIPLTLNRLDTALIELLDALEEQMDDVIGQDKISN